MVRRAGVTPGEGRGADRWKEPPPQNPLAVNTAVLLLLCCGIVAAVAMFTNLSYGLPLYYHPDEPIKAMSAMEFVRGRIPPRFNHPHFMLLFSVPFLHLGNALGVHPILAARASVATLGVATTCMLFLVGNSLAGRLAGFAAALIYATAPLAVVAAHDFKEDAPLAFWLTVQLLFLVGYLRRGRPRDLWLAATALGFGVGTKYTGLIAAPLLVGAALVGPSSGGRWKMLGMATFLAVVGFVASTPSILRYPGDFLTGLSFEGRHAVSGHGILEPWSSEPRPSAENPGTPLTVSPVSFFWTYHLRHSLVPGISIVGVLLVLIGLVIAVTRGDRQWWLMASGFGLFYFVLETLPLKPPPFAPRYMVAALPYAALLGGGALSFALNGGPFRKALLGTLVAATIGLNGFTSFQQVEAMRPDTRDEARAWILQNIPHGARIIIPGLVWYTPFAGSFHQQAFPFEIAAHEDPPISQLRAAILNPRAYLLLSSFNYQRHLDHPGFNPEMYRFYRSLLDGHTPLATFRVPFQPPGYHNPTIMIFHLAGETPGHPSPSPTRGHGGPG
ncbi:MAG: ArnT family glycosyltransferase [Candidatus Methylomirabilis sp.]